MPAPIPADERLRRARAHLAAARAILAGIPAEGRERTYVLLRARKHLIAARPLVLRVVHGRRTGRLVVTDAQAREAEALLREIDAAWPGADYGRKRG